ncbi:MAG: uroporphyrinogen decarboxylase family protein [Planctomycetota bacterium]
MRRERLSGKERVRRAIRHEEPDRVPLNIWMMREDMRARVVERYGSLDRFHAELGIDVHMAVTPPPNRHNPAFVEERMNLALEAIAPADWLDPDDPSIYAGVRELVATYGAEKCVLAHVWGVLESAYSFLGVEQTLLCFGLWDGATRELFARLGAWSARVAANVVELGVDVLHISGDVGGNERMLVSPRTWRERIAPLDAAIVAPGRARGLPLSLHSCGYFRPILDDLIGMGIDVFHPLQQSAGFDLADVKSTWGDRLTIHGGLEIRHYLPRASEAELVAHVRENVLTCKRGGGFIFNTEHTVQPDTSLDRVELAYRTARECGWYS